MPEDRITGGKLQERRLGRAGHVVIIPIGGIATGLQHRSLLGQIAVHPSHGFQSGDAAPHLCPVGLDPVAIVITPNGQRAYVVNKGEDSVSIIDIPTDTVPEAALPANRSSPSVLALNPDGTVLYVLGSGSRFISVVDTTTHQVARVEVDDDPLAVDFTPDGQKAYIT